MVVENKVTTVVAVAVTGSFAVTLTVIAKARPKGGGIPTNNLLQKHLQKRKYNINDCGNKN